MGVREQVPEQVSQAADVVVEHLPGPVREVIARAAEHHVTTLAGGLAFFGIISIAPALGIGLAAVRLVASDQTVTQVVDQLSGLQATLGLGDLLRQMQGSVGRYAGFSVLALLWPATTLASGWTRALDAVHENDGDGGVRGLLGRLKGLGLGLVLLAGFLVLFAAMALATGLSGDRAPAMALAVLGALVLAFATALLLYRFFPSGDRHAFRGSWPGALLATAGLALSTAALGAMLTWAESIAQKYPPSLTTAVVLGLWLYAGNVCLLLGAEYNEVRAGRG